MAQYVSPFTPFKRDLFSLIWRQLFCRRGIHWGVQYKEPTILEFKDTTGTMQRISWKREYCIHCGTGDRRRPCL
jgi:hypothetical protein